MKAIWNETILAESNETIVVEGNHYFPPDSLNVQYFTNSETTSRCPWKGVSNYYSIKVNDETNTDAAWYYPDPQEAAMNIKSYTAFWKGVTIVE